MTVLCLNARSIVNKVQELQLLVGKCNPSVICITETWLHSGVGSSCLGLSGYTVFRKDRDGGESPHGGVLIAVKTNLNPMLQDHNENLEILMICLNIN